MSVLNTANKIYIGATPVSKVYAGVNQVWSAALPLPNTKLFLTYNPTEERADHTGEVGLMFTMGSVSQPITHIAVKCATGNTGPHTVNLYAYPDDILLRTVAIDLTGAATGDYVWAAITPLTLAADASYALMSVTTYGTQNWWEQSPTTYLPILATQRSMYRVIGGGLNPANFSYQYVGLNVGWTDAWGPDESMYAPSATPVNTTNHDTNTFNSGNRIQILADGRITGIRYWRIAGTPAVHAIDLWSDSGTLLVHSMQTGGDGWNEFAITPITVTAGQIIRVVRAMYGWGVGDIWPWTMETPVSVSPNLEWLGGTYATPAPSDAHDDFPSNVTTDYHYYVDIVYQQGSG